MEHCVFCQRKATLTAEHIWAAWIGRLIDAPRYLVSRVDKITGTQKDWHSKALDLKAKLVCDICNNEWMSDLENNETKPLILSMINAKGKFCLTKLGIESLAAFAFKAAVIADHMTTTKPPFFMPSIRARFAKSLVVPSTQIHMWIGWLKPGPNMVGFFDASHDEVRGGTLHNLELYTFTYSIGPVLLQVAAFKRRSGFKGMADYKLVQDPNMSGITPEFWPYHAGKEVIWPPLRCIEDDDLQVFANRWKTLYPAPIRP